MAFCIYCGSKLGDADRFCGACGAKVAANEPVAQSNAAPAIPAEPVIAPVVEEPVVAAPVVEEPVVAAPVVEEPVVAAPVVEEPVVAAPIVEEPVLAAPIVEEPVFAAPVAEEPAAPAVQEPEFPQEPLFAAPITREHVRNAATPSGAQPMPFGNKSARGSKADYSYATADRVANPVQNPAVRPKRKFLVAFASVLLCILLLAAMLPTYLLVTVRNTMTKGTFLSMMQRIDLDGLPATILDESDRSLRGLSVAEAVCDALNEEVGPEVDGWKDLTPKQLDQYLDDSALLPFIAEHAEGVFEALINGRGTYRIPTKDVVALLEKDVDFLVEELGLPLEDEDLNQVAEDLVEELELDQLTLADMADLDEDTKLALDVIGTLFSLYAIAAVALVLLLLVLLLFAVNHRDPMYALRDLGIVSVLGTVLPLLMTLGARLAVSATAGKDAEMYLASVLSSCVLDSSFLYVAIVFALGVVLLIVNGIVRGVQKKKAAV